MNILKRSTVLLLMVFAVWASAQADAISDFTSSKAINAPKAAVLIVDLADGRDLVSHNAEIPLIPASIMKSVTSATLLEKTGNRYRYETPVYLTGELRDGVLDGNILVEASGDPSLNTRNEPASSDFVKEIVDRLQELGIKEILGAVVVDESDFPGPAVNPTWAQGDLSHSYGTGTHGFNFEDNASGKRSVADPAGVFRTRMKNALSAAGITISGVESEHRGHIRKIGEHRSAEIDEIMRSCMMRSDNQFAEAMLRTVGKLYGDEGSTVTGANEEEEFWKRKDAHMEGVKIADGSGLSRSNRVTARFMADVLAHMADNPYYASFFPLAGQEGTLRRFLAGSKLDGAIALKTGSMSGIQCYAGYKLDDDYAPTHIVVVMLNEMTNRGAARAQVEKLLMQTFFPEDANIDNLEIEETDNDE